MICYYCKNQLSDATVYEKCPFCGADLRPGAEKTVFVETTLEESLKWGKQHLSKANTALNVVTAFGVLLLLGSVVLLFTEYLVSGIIGIAFSILYFVVNSISSHLISSSEEIIHVVSKMDGKNHVSLVEKNNEKSQPEL